MQTSEQRRPAIVRENGKRHYHETDPLTAGIRTMLEAHRGDGSFCDVVLSRSPTRDHARLSFGVPGLGKVGPELTAHQLRRLATDLMDAAADIEQNPTSKLRAEYTRGMHASNATNRTAVPELLDALKEAEAGLLFAGADQKPKTNFVPTPTLALREVRAAIAKHEGSAA